MEEYRIRLRPAVGIAFGAAQLLTFTLEAIFSSGRFKLDVNLIMGLFFDACLVVLLKFLTEHAWTLGSWKNVTEMSVWVALTLAALEGPHSWRLFGSFVHFLFHIVYKFLVVYVICACFFGFRNV